MLPVRYAAQLLRPHQLTRLVEWQEALCLQCLQMPAKVQTGPPLRVWERGVHGRSLASREAFDAHFRTICLPQGFERSNLEGTQRESGPRRCPPTDNIGVYAPLLVAGRVRKDAVRGPNVVAAASPALSPAALRGGNSAASAVRWIADMEIGRGVSAGGARSVWPVPPPRKPCRTPALPYSERSVSSPARHTTTQRGQRGDHHRRARTVAR